MKLDSIFQVIENIELDKLMINDLSLWDFAYWELLLPIGASLLAPYIVDWIDKLKRNIRIKSYSKSQINNVKPVQELPKQSFISVVNNSMLKNEYFVVKTLDLEKPFIIPFPTSKKTELENNNFVVVHKNNMIFFELRDALNNYISTYYATNNKLFIDNENKDIDKFIDDIAIQTADNFISQIKEKKVRFNKYLFGVYETEILEDTCNVTVYQSDYFTFKCLTNIFNTLKQITPKNKLPHTETNVTIKNIAPLLNSIGVGGFLIMDRGNGDEIVVAFRGNNCDSGGYWHFTYDETFTSDDNIENVYSFKECISRALTEELGILKKEQEICIPSDQMIMTDIGIIQTSGDDNRFEFEVLSYVRVCFSDKYRFNNFIKGYRFAKDAELETRCLDFVPISDIDKFIAENKMSPEAEALMKKIQHIHMKKILDSDKNGYKSLVD